MAVSLKYAKDSCYENYSLALDMYSTLNKPFTLCSSSETISYLPQEIILLSPFLQELVKTKHHDPMDTPTIIFPDFSTDSLFYFLNILRSGYTYLNEVSDETVQEITEIAMVLQVNIGNSFISSEDYSIKEEISTPPYNDDDSGQYIDNEDRVSSPSFKIDSNLNHVIDTPDFKIEIITDQTSILGNSSSCFNLSEDDQMLLDSEIESMDCQLTKVSAKCIQAIGENIAITDENFQPMLESLSKCDNENESIRVQGRKKEKFKVKKMSSNKKQAVNSRYKVESQGTKLKFSKESRVRSPESDILQSSFSMYGDKDFDTSIVKKEELSTDSYVGSEIEKNIIYEERIMQHLFKIDNLWTCTKCPYSSKSKGHVKEHAERHVPGFTFECPTCKKKFPRKQPLRHHARKCSSLVNN